jgi:TolB-like protein/Tfp pilus assembly protein PilF
MLEPNKAVFLSYASQDAEAAQRICEALRAGGIEVWFDQSELRGGDAWDTAIRKQIKSCGLFIPVISQNTHARGEGYFRLEWKLAVDRSHLISADLPFLLPVTIDGTRDDDERTPERFRELQWTRLPRGETPPAFVERVARLLSPEPSGATGAIPARTSASSMSRLLSARTAPRNGSRAVTLLIGAVALFGVGYFALDQFKLTKHSAPSLPGETAQSAIPEKSIAVLPFVNMSSDKDQEYFSDGLTEEMIDLLGQVPDLRVPARTSSFYFKGKNETIANMAQQLKVAHVLEGSVRKAGKRLRIAAQLIRADNGYHLWSQIYDRDDTDVFAVQDDIAQAVVSALKIKLAAAVQVTGSRGTTSTAAYNLYLLGRQLDRRGSLEGFRHAVEAFRKAIALDPKYAAAYAELAVAEAFVADMTGDTGGIERARHDVDKAIALVPDDAIGYAARSFIRSNWLWDWSGAQADIEKALSLDPRNSDVQHLYAFLLQSLGRVQEAIAAQRKATELDPLSKSAWRDLGYSYMGTGDYAAADVSLGRAIELEPTAVLALFNLGTLRLLQGKAQEALETYRKMDLEFLRISGFAMAEHALGRAKESQQALDELMGKHAQEAAYQISEVFAWRGEKDKAIEWLDRAYKQQDGGLSSIKTDPLLKSLRADPRFTALLRKMKLPE